MLNHLYLLAGDLRCIFLKERGIREPWRLLGAHLRIKAKQIYLRISGEKRQNENILGIKMAFPDYDCFAHLWREIFVSENYYFKSDISDPRIVDVGGNIGVSVCFFKYLYPQSKIICFEPDPEAFRWLKINVEANGFKDVALYNAVAGMAEGKVRFYEHPTEAASGMNSTRANMIHGGTPVAIDVKSMRLSAVMNGEIDVLKVDAEGGEYDVVRDLADSGKFLFVKRIFLELHQGDGMESDPMSYALGVLEKNGFRYAVTGTFLGHHDFMGSPSRSYAIMIDAVKIKP